MDSQNAQVLPVKGVTRVRIIFLLPFFTNDPRPAYNRICLTWRSTNEHPFSRVGKSFTNSMINLSLWQACAAQRCIPSFMRCRSCFFRKLLK